MEALLSENKEIMKKSASKIRRADLLCSERDHRSRSLKKWDFYRDERLDLIKDYIYRLKEKRRVKIYLGLILL